MTEVTGQTVETLKAAGHFFAAGALAHSLGGERNYGCHYGMRSTLAASKIAFNEGWDAAAYGGSAYR